ncbi:MAG: PAS domain S-box protein [Imperialibacter sp.]|uniref:PAS domain S-box protein n=1 Tax=Imperialibacter sp. TaxID=2038411 RepID=UPI0032EDA9D4
MLNKSSNHDAHQGIDFGVLFADHIGAMLAYWDKNEVCRFANKAYREWFGKSHEQMVGKITMQELLGSLYEKNQPLIAEVLKGNAQHFERELTKPSGEARNVQANYYPDIQNGEVMGFFVHVADISATKKLENEIKASEMKFRGLLESAPDAIVLVDKTGAINMINSMSEKLFGYTRNELLGKPIELLIPERFRKAHPSQRSGFFTNPHARPMGEGLELFGLKKNGTEFPVEISISPIELPEGMFVSAAIRDISWRKKAEEELRASEMKFRGLLESAPDAMVMVDKNGVINMVNSMTEELFGYKRDTLLGCPIETLIPERFRKAHPGKRSRFFANPHARPMGEGLELFGLKKNGTEFPVEISISPIELPEGMFVSAAIRDISWRKSVEEEVNASNERNKIFVDQSPNAIAMFDTELRYMAASRKWIDDYSLSGRDILGHSHYEVFPEIGDEWKTIHRECLAGAINTCEEACFKRADGTEQWITWDIRPWYISEGKIGGLLMYTTDITQSKIRDIGKKRVEYILEKTNQIAKVSTWEFDIDRGITIWDDIANDIFDLPQGTRPDKDAIINCYEQESRNKLLAATEELATTGKPYDLDLQVISAKGNQKWLRIIGEAEFADGRCVKRYGMIEDITDRKLAEEALHKANEELNAIVNTGPIAIIGTDKNGTITHFNRGAELMLQYSAKEMVGLQTPQLIHVEAEVLKRSTELTELFGREISGFDTFVELAKQGNHESREWTYVRKDGTKFPVQLIVTALRNQTEEISGFLGIATNITERIEDQKRLLEAKNNLEILAERLTKQNSQLTNFTHIISHNLRSPVGNLTSLLHLYEISEEKEEKELIFSKFEIVIEHLSSTLNTLINTLKIKTEDANILESVRFDEVLKKTMEIITVQIEESEIAIKSDFSAVAEIQYNRSYIESIFLNLLTNAVKYRSAKRKPQVSIVSTNENGRVILKFSDNGLGIDMDKFGDKLFGLNKTFHGNDEAKGVGLFLTKTQIEALGGSITAESEPGKGTTFIITFS